MEWRSVHTADQRHASSAMPIIFSHSHLAAADVFCYPSWLGWRAHSNLFSQTSADTVPHVDPRISHRFMIHPVHPDRLPSTAVTSSLSSARSATSHHCTRQRPSLRCAPAVVACSCRSGGVQPSSRHPAPSSYCASGYGKQTARYDVSSQGILSYLRLQTVTHLPCRARRWGHACFPLTSRWAYEQLTVYLRERQGQYRAGCPAKEQAEPVPIAAATLSDSATAKSVQMMVFRR